MIAHTEKDWFSTISPVSDRQAPQSRKRQLRSAPSFRRMIAKPFFTSLLVITIGISNIFGAFAPVAASQNAATSEEPKSVTLQSKKPASSLSSQETARLQRAIEEVQARVAARAIRDKAVTMSQKGAPSDVDLIIAGVSARMESNIEADLTYLTSKVVCNSSRNHKARNVSVCLNVVSKDSSKSGVRSFADKKEKITKPSSVNIASLQIMDKVCGSFMKIYDCLNLKKRTLAQRQAFMGIVNNYRSMNL